MDIVKYHNSLREIRTAMGRVNDVERALMILGIPAHEDLKSAVNVVHECLREIEAYNNQLLEKNLEHSMHVTAALMSVATKVSDNSIVME